LTLIAAGPLERRHKEREWSLIATSAGDLALAALADPAKYRARGMREWHSDQRTPATGQAEGTRVIGNVMIPV